MHDVRPFPLQVADEVRMHLRVVPIAVARPGSHGVVTIQCTGIPVSSYSSHVSGGFPILLGPARVDGDVMAAGAQPASDAVVAAGCHRSRSWAGSARKPARSARRATIESPRTDGGARGPLRRIDRASGACHTRSTHEGSHPLGRRRHAACARSRTPAPSSWSPSPTSRSSSTGSSTWSTAGIREFGIVVGRHRRRDHGGRRRRLPMGSRRHLHPAGRPARPRALRAHRAATSWATTTSSCTSATT